MNLMPMIIKLRLNGGPNTIISYSSPPSYKDTLISLGFTWVKTTLLSKFIIALFGGFSKEKVKHKIMMPWEKSDLAN